MSLTPGDHLGPYEILGILGAGGIVPLPMSTCVVDAVRQLVAYNARESCGKCTPCREGTVRLLNEFDHLGADSLDTINALNDILAFASLCGLGQMAPNPVRALMKHFPVEVDEHVRGHCARGVCFLNGVA